MVNTDLESLPWQWAPVEVHEDVSQAFHVVSPRLLDAQVRVDRGISEQEEGEDGGGGGDGGGGDDVDDGFGRGISEQNIPKL